MSEINNTAEFGGISDVTTISKGGGDQFHGSLFENHQNSAFAARNTFSAKVPKLIMNDFGGSVGGPVLFQNCTTGATKPSSSWIGRACACRSSRCWWKIAFAGIAQGDLSVYPAGTVRDLNGTPFPGNLIPTAPISPVSTIMQYLFPLPNAGAPNAVVNNYVQNFPTPIKSDQGDVRLDQLVSKQQVFARFTYKVRQNQLLPCNCASNNLNGSALSGSVTVPQHYWSLTGAYSYVITPHIVNEFRAGWTGFHQITGYGINGAQIEDQVGLTPYIQQNKSFLEKVNATPNVRIAGFQRTGGVGSSIQQTQTTSSWITSR